MENPHIKFQLVDDDANLIQDAKKKLLDLKLHGVGKDYYSLGIIGAQSSGKSTLLNHLFGTSFDVLDKSKHRKQTTKGIWVSRDPKSNLLVFDIEGSDSRERWEGKTSFERSTALFGLVLSNILIINLWTQEIGRFTASNYEIIKIIFEINLRLFNQESPKQLLFVIRDFDKSAENFEYIRKTVSADLVKIWDEIKKPKQFEHMKPEDFYKVDFFSLSHFIYQKEEFVKNCDELGSLFRDKTKDGFLFKNVDTSTNLPMDGLFLYIERVWETIKENKELNLPSQKIMVSNYRCSEVKRESLDLAQPEIMKLLADVKKSVDPNFKENVDILMNKSVKFFKANTDQYDDDIVSDKQRELKEDLFRNLKSVSEIQEDKLEANSYHQFTEQLMQYKSMKVFATLLKSCKELKVSNTEEFKTKLTNTSINENIDRRVKEYSSKLESTLKEFFIGKINTVLKSIQNTKYKRVESKLLKIFSELNVTFWQDFLGLFNDIFSNYEEEVNLLKKDCEELESTFNEGMINEMKIELYLLIKASVRIKTDNFSKYLVDKFRRDFECTQSGVRRNFGNILEDRISEIFSEAKAKTISVIEEAETAIFPEMLNESAHNVFEREQLAKLKNRVSEKMDGMYDSVLDKKNNRGGWKNIPWWFWALFVYIGYEKILGLMTSPLMLLIIIAAAALFGYLISQGKLNAFITTLGMISKPLTGIIKNFMPGNKGRGATKAKND